MKLKMGECSLNGRKTTTATPQQDWAFSPVNMACSSRVVSGHCSSFPPKLAAFETSC